MCSNLTLLKSINLQLLFHIIIFDYLCVFHLYNLKLYSRFFSNAIVSRMQHITLPVVVNSTAGHNFSQERLDKNDEIKS